MWICANNGFISIVKDRNDPTRVVVRARRQEDLESIFPAYTDLIIETDESDYQFRIFADQEQVAMVIHDMICSIEYDNFKNSVPDKELHDTYARFWYIGQRMQPNQK